MMLDAYGDMKSCKRCDVHFRTVEKVELCSLCREGASKGRKFDGGKPRFDLLVEGVPQALEEVARVLTFGSIKYEDHNWMLVSGAQHRYLAAGMRHEIAVQRGETIDPDSGLHHLAHKLCCDLFRLELILREGDSCRAT